MNTSAPIRIEADRMESSQDKNVIVFTGNVHANQDNLIINANTMTVAYRNEADQPDSSIDVPVEGLSRKIDSITAKGNVKIVQGDWIANGDSMDFDAEKRIVTLSGNAQAFQEQNMISGETIILYLNEGKSVVERGSVEGKRVKAFIYPGSQEEKDEASSQGK